MTDEPFETGAGRAPQDELAITGIECFAHHGVFDFEKREGQTFVVDLVLGMDTRPAAAELAWPGATGERLRAVSYRVDPERLFDGGLVLPKLPVTAGA